MAWVSKTQQFTQREIQRIESSSAVDLKASLMVSGPIVALRGAAEVLLNEDEAKLDFLLHDDQFNAYWRQYNSDWSVTLTDHMYAVKLNRRIRQKTTN